MLLSLGWIQILLARLVWMLHRANTLYGKVLSTMTLLTVLISWGISKNKSILVSKKTSSCSKLTKWSDWIPLRFPRNSSFKQLLGLKIVLTCLWTCKRFIKLCRFSPELEAKQSRRHSAPGTQSASWWAQAYRDSRLQHCHSQTTVLAGPWNGGWREGPPFCSPVTAPIVE